MLSEHFEMTSKSKKNIPKMNQDLDIPTGNTRSISTVPIACTISNQIKRIMRHVCPTQEGRRSVIEALIVSSG